MSETAPSTQLVLPESVTAEVVKTSNPDVSKVVHRSKRGLFVKRPTTPSAKQVRQALASKLTAPLDDTGRTHLEEAFDAQLAISKRTDVEDVGTAPTKAYEAVLKSAGLLEKTERELPSLTIIFAPLALPHPEIVDADAPRKELKPAWADAEVVSTNEPSRS